MGDTNDSADTSTTKDRTGLPWGSIGLATLLAVVAAAVLFVVLSKPDPPLPRLPASESPPAASFLSTGDIGFAPVEVPIKRITDERLLLERPANLNPEDAARIQKAWANLNKAQMARKGETHIRQASDDFAFAIAEAYSGYGAAGVYAAIDLLWPQFQTSLAALRKAVTNGATQPEALVKAPPAGSEIHVERAGAFILIARQAGLMDNKGGIEPRLEPIIEILFRYRVVSALRGTLQPLELMTRAEVGALNQWRLHEARQVDNSRKEQYIRLLGEIYPTYPVRAAMGVVVFQDGKPSLAREHFQAQATATPELADLMNRWLEEVSRQLGTNPAPAPAPPTSAASPTPPPNNVPSPPNAPAPGTTDTGTADVAAPKQPAPKTP